MWCFICLHKNETIHVQLLKKKKNLILSNICPPTTLLSSPLKAAVARQQLTAAFEYLILI